MTDLPTGKELISCKFIYKIKYKSDGSIGRYIARLVAKDFTQKEMVDYQETFSLVAKITTVSCLLAIDAARVLRLHQFDVNNAFLQGDLNEEIYKRKPLGYNKGRPNQVCRLN